MRKKGKEKERERKKEKEKERKRERGRERGRERLDREYHERRGGVGSMTKPAREHGDREVHILRQS